MCWSCGIHFIGGHFEHFLGLMKHLDFIAEPEISLTAA